MKRQSELVRALRAQLAATEKELADQKWIHDQFLNSPAWRWTTPIRWAVNQVRRLGNGHVATSPPDIYKPKRGLTDPVSSDKESEAKLAFSNLCQLALDS